MDDDILFRGPPMARAALPPAPVGRTLSSAKDPIVARLRDLGNAAGRRARGQFLAEGPLLASRALDDLPVEDMFYTGELLRDPAGAPLLQRAGDLGVPAYRVSDGLMGLITPTRPLPLKGEDLGRFPIPLKGEDLEHRSQIKGRARLSRRIMS
jgi:TrmH family RNA methyltransferase